MEASRSDSSEYEQGAHSWSTQSGKRPTGLAVALTARGWQENSRDQPQEILA